MNLKPFLASLLALSLVACGSGGGSDHHAQKADSNNANQNVSLAQPNARFNVAASFSIPDTSVAFPAFDYSANTYEYERVVKLDLTAQEQAAFNGPTANQTLFEKNVDRECDRDDADTRNAVSCAEYETLENRSALNALGLTDGAEIAMFTYASSPAILLMDVQTAPKYDSSQRLLTDDAIFSSVFGQVGDIVQRKSRVFYDEIELDLRMPDSSALESYLDTLRSNAYGFACDQGTQYRRDWFCSKTTQAADESDGVGKTYSWRVEFDDDRYGGLYEFDVEWIVKKN